jgi:hypothetical protein
MIPEEVRQETGPSLLERCKVPSERPDRIHLSVWSLALIGNASAQAK